MTRNWIGNFVFFAFIFTSIAQESDNKALMSGRSFTYKVAKDTYHIELTFNTETQITWKYLAAPEGQEGKTSTENITRRDLRDDLLLMIWDEADGTKVIDILDLGKMKLYANFVTPGGKRFLSETDVVEHSTLRKNQAMQRGYIQEKVTFISQGDTIVGNLYKPATQNDKPSSVVVILGPVAFVKEQAPTEYAKRLAQKGYTALVFDPRYHGESAGEPRRFESGDAKTEDLIAAVDFVQTLNESEPTPVNLLGICQGINWVSRVAADDPRVNSVGLVAGHYLNNKVAEAYLGGKEGVKARLESARLAKEKFEQTGEVEYIPIVSLTDKNALLTFKPIYDWYIPWANNSGESSKEGQWENRITRMSELDIWGVDIAKDLSRITIPLVMIHSNKAASGPLVPKELFEIIPSKKKDLIWFEEQFQTKFYDDPETINRVVNHLVEKFNL